MNLAQLRSIQNNAGYAIVCGKSRFLYVSRQKGIAPIMDQLIKNRTFFKDCIIVDAVIGKASAMMLVYGNARHIHGRIMSKAAIDFLQMHSVSFSYDEACPYIINRAKDGMCPMEQAVCHIDAMEQAYQVLIQKQHELRQ